jgi:uncharacterized membrane protein
LPQKRAEAQEFFSGTREVDRPGFLYRYGVAYLLYGPRERTMGEFEPGQATYLEPVFQRGEVTIYRVALGEERQE